MDIKKIIKEKVSISEAFYQKTKIKNFPKNNLSPDEWPESWKKIYSKDYPRFKKISLPKNLPLIKNALSESLLKRKSQREFVNKNVDIKTLAALLFYSGGVIPGSKNWETSRRFYPSAGARYPLEIYISTQNINGLKDGLYHYSVKQHSLTGLLIKQGLNEQIARYSSQKWLENANIIIMLGAVFQRNQMKYNERGLRYIFFDAGHLGQNFYLVATALGLKICAVGGFCDDKINKLIDVDGETEGVVYLFGVGV